VKKRGSRALTRPAKRSGWLRRFAGLAVLFIAVLYGAWGVSLFALRFINPFTTGVQIQRRIEGIFRRGPYHKRYTFVPLQRISPELQHAVIAAEDGRFYQHHGIDWKAVQKVVDDSRETGTVTRGASTITQQLVKNLYFTTHRNPLRKAFEYTLAPMADGILGKRRVLELYLNVVEWGPGVYGAEAAAQYHYGISAARLDREQSARLAACLPSPRRRKPARMNNYSALIVTLWVTASLLSSGCSKWAGSVLLQC
jgi:monofunctional biosynthetic peptidoglycan transglycosylase